MNDEAVTNETSTETPSAEKVSWTAALSDELKADPSINKFSDINGLAKSYINAQQMIGRDKIPMPTNESEFQEVYKRLGRPDDATGYELSVPEAPDGYNVNEELMGGFKDQAFKLGLNTDQANKLFGWYMNESIQGMMAQQAEAKQSFEEGEAQLKTDWGGAFDKNLVIANRAVKEFGGEELQTRLQELGVDNDPVLLKAFNNIGKQVLEDGKLDGDGLPVGKSPAEIDAEIGAIMANPAYLNAQDPAHKGLVAQVQKLMAQKHGEV